MKYSYKELKQRFEELGAKPDTLIDFHYSHPRIEKGWYPSELSFSLDKDEDIPIRRGDNDYANGGR